jgi:serine/threonine-protein kinase
VNGTTLLKVLDFGISKVAPRPGEVAITTTDSLVGSPLYMAPEQMRSSKEVDARADVWSLGLILFELLAGAPAFEGESVPEVCVNVMTGTPLAITRFRDDVPDELQAILLKCVEKDRERRHPSMGALARALERFAAQQVRVHAERASAALKTARSIETLPDVSDHLPSRTDRDAETRSRVAPPPRRRKRPVWLAIGGATCLLAAIVGALIARSAASAGQVGTLASAPSPAPSVSSAPVATVELASVPFDSLPVAPHDAGAARAVSSTARKPASVPPAASSSAGTQQTQKDGWKWGDRN